MRLSTVLQWVLGASFLAALCCWLFMALGTVSSFYLELLVGVFFLTSGITVIAMPCANALEKGKLRGLMWCGLALASFSEIGWIAVLWLRASFWADLSEAWYELLGVTTVAAVWIMLLGLVVVYRMPNMTGRVVRMFTVGINSLTALQIMYFILYPDNLWGIDGRKLRYLWVMIVLSLFATLLTIILARLRQLTTGDETADNEVRLGMTVWCPRCELCQPMQTGGGHCTQCGLTIRVTAT